MQRKSYVPAGTRGHDEEVQLYAFDILALDGKDLRGLPLSMRKTGLARLLAPPRWHLRGAVRPAYKEWVKVKNRK